MMSAYVSVGACVKGRKFVCVFEIIKGFFFLPTSLKLTSLNIQKVTSLLSANKQLSLSEPFIKDLMKCTLFLGFVFISD